MTRYPTLPDAQITDWYAGASLSSLGILADLDEADWESGDATVAFSDIGPREAGQPSHGQLVVYVVDHGLGAAIRAASAEIDPADARLIARRLLAWARKAEKEA